MSKEIKIVELPHSVKLTINGKGHMSGECKVYADTPENALKKACEIATNIKQIVKENNDVKNERIWR